MSELRLHDIPEIAFFYKPCEVTHETMNECVADVMVDLLEMVKNRSICHTGNLLLVYRGTRSDIDDTFELWVGLPVLRGTAPRDGFLVTDLPAFRCAASVHVGASRDIAETYGELIQMMRAQNLEPSREIREEYLHWEGRNSDNDVTWVQLGVQDGLQHAMPEPARR